MSNNQEFTQKLQEHIKRIVIQLYGEEAGSIPVEIERPNNPEHGDYSANIAMKIVKIVGKNPMEIAEKIQNEIRDLELEEISDIDVIKPGFINFRLNIRYFVSTVHSVLNERERYGMNNSLKGKTILIEHTSPNPNKEFHLGHLKNNVTGLSISYILEANGAKVFRDCIDNNRGIAIAKLMWGYLKFARKEEGAPIDISYWFDHQNEWFTPEDKKISSGKFVDELYVKGSDDFKVDTEVEKSVRQLVIDWESEDPKNWELWKLTQKWVWDGYKQSMGRVNGWKFDHIWHEHELYKFGKEHVQKGLELGVFRKLEDGAVLTDLKKDFNLPDTILIKNDGTSLYITQDLELTKRKREMFNPDEMMWVIGPEQSLAMKQMFAACSQLGFGKYEDYHHIPYGFILVKDESGNPKKMSSRGKFKVHVNDLIDSAKEEIKKYVTTEFNPKELDELIETIAIGAIKYSLLKVSRTQDMVFDFQTTISLDGDSGPYIMYTYTRANSILKNINIQSLKSFKLTREVLQSTEELAVLKLIEEFPEIVQEASKDYSPNLISNLIYNLAQAFNSFYTKHSVLKAEDENLKQSRLALTVATAQVIKNGMKLLGIEMVEKM